MNSIEILNPYDQLSDSISLDKAASMIKVGDYRLPEDPAQWNAAIQDSIESQHPNVVRIGSNPHIVYKNKDWGEGCAMGSISITVGKNLIVFPIVIRYGNLSPFDMSYIYNGDRWIHTSEENMREFESDNDSLFGAVTNKKTIGDDEYDDRWEYLAAPRGYDFKGGSRVFKGAGSERAMCPIEPLDAAMKYAASHKDRIYYTTKEVKQLFKNAAEVVQIALDSLTNSYDDEKPLEDMANHPFEKVERREENIDTYEDKPPIKAANSYSDEENMPSIFAQQFPDESIEPLKVIYEKKTNYVHDDPAFKTGAMNFFNLLHVKKAGLGQYTITVAKRGYDGAFSMTGDIHKVASTLCSGDMKLAVKVLDAVDDAEDILLDSSIEDSNTGHIETLQDMKIIDDANRITRYGIYNVFTEDGTKETGHVLPVFDWDGERTTMFLFVSELNWALQSNINGSISGRQSKLPNGVLRPGRKGALVFDEDGKGLSFPPIEIKSVLLKKGGTVIRGMDLGSMKGVNLVMTKDAPGVMLFGESNDPDSWMPGHINAYIPLGAKFVPLPEEVTKIASKEAASRAIETKFASLATDNAILEKIADNQYLVESAGDLCKYPEGIDMIMKDAEKISYSGNRALTKKEASFALKASGAIMVEDMIEVTKTGNRTMAPVESNSHNMRSAMIEAANVNHYLSLPSRYKTAAEELRLDIEPVLDVVTLAPMLGKFARKVLKDVLDTAPEEVCSKIGMLKGAEYEDKPSLDDLFELGFLNDKSLRYYADKLKDIEDLEDLLCKVLLTTRISSFGMDEDSAQNALYGVSELKNVLKQINFKLHRTE